MKKDIIIGMSIGILVSAALAGGYASSAGHGAPDVESEESADQPKKHGKEDKKVEEDKPKVNYEYFPDVQSLDDLSDDEAAVDEEGADQDKKEEKTKIVYKTPPSCQEFSFYLDTKAQKLDRLEKEILQKEKMLKELQKQFEETTTKYTVTETKVKKLLNADPSNLKDNPELTKMARLYETLAPDDAASRIQNLDLDMTIALLKDMKPKKVSKIMSALDPKISAALSSRIVRGF